MSKKPSAIVVGVGAELGLGAALCRKFATNGYHVFVARRTLADICFTCELALLATEQRSAEVLRSAGALAHSHGRVLGSVSQVAGALPKACRPSRAC